MAALLAVQTVAHAEDTKPETIDTVETPSEKAPQSWIWKNGRYVLAGAAVVGLGAAATYYNQDIINWINSLTPEQAKFEKTKLEQEIAADLKDVALEINDANKKEEKIAQKQTTLEYLSSFFSSQPPVVESEESSDDWGADYERSVKEGEADRADRANRAEQARKLREYDGFREYNDYQRGDTARKKNPGAFAKASFKEYENIARVGAKLRENAEIKAAQAAETQKNLGVTINLPGSDKQLDLGTEIAPGVVVYKEYDNSNISNNRAPADQATANAAITKIVSRWD